ncbi:MAG: hypothetical protein KatS3mg027_2334 [Bacteroidia bacterium]|nr:MAG: hypothetical protein KatS3mg027_2334 [Bacteroidia bacterium]
MVVRRNIILFALLILCYTCKAQNLNWLNPYKVNCYSIGVNEQICAVEPYIVLKDNLLVVTDVTMVYCSVYKNGELRFLLLTFHFDVTYFPCSKQDCSVKIGLKFKDGSYYELDKDIEAIDKVIYVYAIRDGDVTPYGSTILTEMAKHNLEEIQIEVEHKEKGIMLTFLPVSEKDDTNIHFTLLKTEELVK